MRHIHVEIKNINQHKNVKIEQKDKNISYLLKSEKCSESLVLLKRKNHIM